MPILWNRTLVFLYHLVNRPIHYASEKDYNSIYWTLLTIVVPICNMTCCLFPRRDTVSRSLNSLTSDNVTWDITIWASLTTCDAYGYGEYEIYSMTQQRQSGQMSHFQMLLLLGLNTVGHILKTALQCGVQWKSLFKALASGFHYSEGSVCSVCPALL